MQRLAIAVVLCLSVLACQAGGAPTQPTPTSTPPGSITRIIALEGDLNFGDIVVPRSPRNPYVSSTAGLAP